MKSSKSYVATRLGVFNRVSEARSLYRLHKGQSGEHVRRLLEEARYFGDVISGLRGETLNGAAVLEVGPGQKFVELAYFAVDNDATAIDTDYLALRLGPVGLVRMLKSNGWLRTAKTLVRKGSGIDREARRELLSGLGVISMPAMRLLQMDATRMTFGDGSFDAVYSRAVFEHLADPARVIAEIRRVLKPGGVMLIRIHLYTSDSGAHDARVLEGGRRGVSYWAHLRPAHKHESRPNSFLNELRLDEWRRLFDTGMPGSTVTALQDAPASDRDELARLRTAGDLEGYSDEELLSRTVDVVWRKPQ